MYPYIHLGPLQISTYFLVISLASLFSTLWFIRRAEERHMNRLTAIDISLLSLVGGFVCARLLHVFYEEPRFYAEHPLQILEVWNGGFIFLGGVVGAFGTAYLFCILKKEPFLFWADLAVPPLSLTYAFGRIACFLNGCCYGGRCELPWAVTVDAVPRHPTQLYASIWEFALLGILLKIGSRTSGLTLGLWLVVHGVGRMIMEHFRDDPRGAFINGQSLGTWMSLGLVIIGLGLLLTRPILKRPESNS